MKASKTASAIRASDVSQLGPECALINLKRVSKIYKTDAGDFPALKDLDLCFGKGEFASIMGKSGSGKSTLVNMITGIDHPTDGAVRVDGADIHTMSEGQLAVWRGRTMGVVFQFFQLLPMLSVLENTLLPMDFCNVYLPEEREQRALALLETLDLVDVADDLPAALSGGQQQIAAIARALANDPPIIVADEPTGNLDARTAERILGILADLALKGKTIIIVTHDPDLGYRTERQILLSDGELIDEHIAQAFPNLPHPKMLQASRQALRRRYEAGAVIAGESVEPGLYLVKHGEVEVLRNGNHKPPKVVDRLQPGEYFNLLGLPGQEVEHLSFRASSAGQVDLLWLNREAFQGFQIDASGQADSFRRYSRMSNDNSIDGANDTVEEVDDVSTPLV